MLYTAESKFSDKLPLLKSNEQCWPWLLWFTFQPIFIICAISWKASKGLRRHILCHQNSDCVSQLIYIHMLYIYSRFWRRTVMVSAETWYVIVYCFREHFRFSENFNQFSTAVSNSALTNTPPRDFLHCTSNTLLRSNLHCVCQLVVIYFYFANTVFP